MAHMTPQNRIKRLTRFIADGRIIRNRWHGIDDAGRETACLLGALGPDIDDPRLCPAEVMPGWLAHLTPHIDDETSVAAWPGIIQRYGELARRWHVLDAAAWRRCEMRTKRAPLEIVIRQEVSGIILPVITLINRVLRGDEPSIDEWNSVAISARNASRQTTGVLTVDAAVRAAALTAMRATWQTTDAAARTAAWAAKAASLWVEARLATWPAAITATMDTTALTAEARVDTWDRIAVTCLDAIEAEITVQETRQ